MFVFILFLRISVSKKSQIWNLTKIRPVGVADPWDWVGRRKVGTSKGGSATRIAIWIFQATERSRRHSLRVSRAAARAGVDWVHVWVCQNLSYKIESGCGCKHSSMNTTAWSPVMACKFWMPTVFPLVFENWRLGVLSPSLEGLWHRWHGEQRPKKLWYRCVITASPLNSFYFLHYFITVPLLCGLAHLHSRFDMWLYFAFSIFA